VNQLADAGQPDDSLQCRGLGLPVVVFRVAAAEERWSQTGPLRRHFSKDGTLVARSSQQALAELAALSTTGSEIRALTSHNGERFARLTCRTPSTSRFGGAARASALLKPPMFDAAKNTCC
jgi:hypothetical protein